MAERRARHRPAGFAVGRAPGCGAGAARRSRGCRPRWCSWRSSVLPPPGTQWRAAVANAKAALKSERQATANAERAVKSEQEAVSDAMQLARSNRGLRLAGYASAMQLAQREWELGNVPRVRKVLDSLGPAQVRTTSADSSGTTSAASATMRP